MALIKNGFLVEDNLVFLPSSAINVFPCARRGQNDTATSTEVTYYDPEARLNTERTNRLHTAVNGFKDSFIASSDFAAPGTLVFVLAGYRVEIKNFDPSTIATMLGADVAAIYAHLRLHTDVSLDAAGYFTEMLFRQSIAENDRNYLDVKYTDEKDTTKGDYFFVGISFAAEPVISDDAAVVAHNLQLFANTDGGWELVQTSLLPKVDHDTTPDSVKISGDFAVKHGEQTSFKVTKDKITLGSTDMSDLEVAGKATIHNGLKVANGSTELGDLTATTLTVGIDKFRVTNTEANFAVPVNLTKKLTIADGSELKTPQLRVNRITSDDGSITIDGKKLVVNKSLEMLAKDGEPAKATIAQAIIGDLTVTQDDKFPNSSGKITADEVWLKDIGQVPAVEIAHFAGTNTYQLRFKFKTTPIIEDVPQPPSADDIQPNTIILTDESGNTLTDVNDLILVFNAG